MRAFLTKWMVGCLLFVLVCVGGTLYAQAVTYQQEKLMLIDPVGDSALEAVFLATCETGAKKCVAFRNVAPQSSQLRTPRFAKENPILNIPDNRIIDNSRVFASFDVKETTAKLQAIIQEGNKNYPVTYGGVHIWAAGAGFGWSKFLLSKPVMALATATSSRFMYVGQEEHLIKWILAQKNKSVTIDRKSVV